MASSLEARVVEALAAIRNPRLDNDLLSAGMIRDLSVTDAGGVSFTFLLSPEDPATLVRQARAAVQAIDGVRREEIKITVTNPAGPARTTHPPPSTPAATPPAAAPTPAEQANLGRIIAVSSGKGGVGKSTVAVNLAVALAQEGARVGVMDADIYGPNIPRMFGVFEKPPVIGGKIQPLEAHGVKLMSLGFLVERDAPAIWRGPIIMKIVTQFLKDVDWGELDYFLVDLPPGTGDAQLSLVAGHAGLGRDHRHHPAGDGRGRRAPRCQDVRARGRAGDRRGREHERVRRSRRPATGSSCSPPAAASGWRRRSARRCSGACRSSPAWPSWPTPGQPILVASPDSPAAVSLRDIAGCFDGRPPAGARRCRSCGTERCEIVPESP